MSSVTSTAIWPSHSWQCWEVLQTKCISTCVGTGTFIIMSKRQSGSQSHWNWPNRGFFWDCCWTTIKRPCSTFHGGLSGAIFCDWFLPLFVCEGACSWSWYCTYWRSCWNDTSPVGALEHHVCTFLWSWEHEHLPWDVSLSSKGKRMIRELSGWKYWQTCLSQQ